jgi:hypothetical protein
MPKLLDIILALHDEDRRALSAIWIERAADGEWQARFSIARNQYAEGQAIERIANHPLGEAPDTQDLPRGIAMVAWVRVPDQIYPIDIDELQRNTDVRAQAHAVQESGLIGKLDMARYDRADRSTSYLIKSHAGSQEERTAWLLSLRERPENTIFLDEGHEKS